MNCEVLELALLTVEQYQIQEVLRCLLHTILFNRALGPVKPCEVESELFELSYVQCGDAEVERTIEDKVHRLGQWVDRNPGKRVTVALSFFEKRYKQNWFAKHEERLYWEQWRVHLDVKPQEADPQPGDGASARRALQTSLQACVLELLRLVNDRREHIPPVVSSEVVCFPYEITLPSDADGHFGLDMLKRVVLNSNPPPMLA